MNNAFNHTIISWNLRAYTLSEMSETELNELLDEIIEKAAQQVSRAESWPVDEWQKRRPAFESFLTSCAVAKAAVEQALAQLKKADQVAA